MGVYGAAMESIIIIIIIITIIIINNTSSEVLQRLVPGSRLLQFVFLMLVRARNSQFFFSQALPTLGKLNRLL